MKDARAVRADLDTSTDLDQRARLFQDTDIEAFTGEAIGKREAAQARARDNHPRGSIGV